MRISDVIQAFEGAMEEVNDASVVFEFRGKENLVLDSYDIDPGNYDGENDTIVVKLVEDAI